MIARERACDPTPDIEPFRTHDPSQPAAHEATVSQRCTAPRLPAVRRWQPREGTSGFGVSTRPTRRDVI